ncbi:MAG: UDP-galactopyranose mutase [Chryseolinea sp.]
MDCRYFTDKYQCLPSQGYTKMMENMLMSRNITVALESDYRKIKDRVAFRHMIYTGSLDEFFNYSYGILPYRTLRFEHETMDVEYYQPVQQVNYPNDFDFTRIVEWKHATGQRHKKTTITREYPSWAREDDES